MKQKISLSLLLISLTLIGIINATLAYFSSDAVLSDNILGTGTVKLDHSSIIGNPIALNNLIPGETVSTDPIGIRYGGNIPADLYLGMKLTDGGIINPVLDFNIDEVTSDGDFVKNVIESTSTVSLLNSWTQIITGITEDEVKYYKFYFTLNSDASNNFQGISTTNDLIIYAVQKDYLPPTDIVPQDYEPDV